MLLPGQYQRILLPGESAGRGGFGRFHLAGQPLVPGNGSWAILGQEQTPAYLVATKPGPAGLSCPEPLDRRACRPPVASTTGEAPRI